MKCLKNKSGDDESRLHSSFFISLLLFVVNKCRLYRDCNFSERNFDFSLYIDSQNTIFHNITKF